MIVQAPANGSRGNVQRFGQIIYGYSFVHGRLGCAISATILRNKIEQRKISSLKQYKICEPRIGLKNIPEGDSSYIRSVIMTLDLHKISDLPNLMLKME